MRWKTVFYLLHSLFRKDGWAWNLIWIFFSCIFYTLDIFEWKCLLRPALTLLKSKWRFNRNFFFWANVKQLIIFFSCCFKASLQQYRSVRYGFEMLKLLEISPGAVTF